MTQKARERIDKEFNKKFLEIFRAKHIPYQDWNGDTIRASLTDIIDVLKQLGYPLPPKLELITMELPKHWGGDSELSGLESVAFEEGKQAQLVADQKAIEGVK